MLDIEKLSLIKASTYRMCSTNQSYYIERYQTDWWCGLNSVSVKTIFWHETKNGNSNLLMNLGRYLGRYLVLRFDTPHHHYPIFLHFPSISRHPYMPRLLKIRIEKDNEKTFSWFTRNWYDWKEPHCFCFAVVMVANAFRFCLSVTRPYTRQHQLRAVGRGSMVIGHG